MPTEAEYRLPRSVVPHHYDLTLKPDLEDASFVGSERISVEVIEPIDAIVLNSAELEIGEVFATDAADRSIEMAVTFDESAERATLQAPETLSPGPWTLSLSFSGVLNDRLVGFYRSRYDDEEGETRTIAASQFEATEARRAFPCWDEPDLKATFDVTLDVEDHLLAVSNSAVIEEVIADGRKIVRFATTMKMSTYLVAFVVGPLEATDPVDVDGVPLRVIHQPGKGALTEFSLEAATFSLQFLRDYYDIDYPGDKLDLIALPDFAWGAMENLGAVTFRENLLIVDTALASHGELLRIADVIAHEIAHMWFGDLVTMKWWNGIWLNEAFATFMELKTTDAFRPEWNRWVRFGIEAAAGKQVDALENTRPIEFPVGSPDEANEMFDALTYLKGSAVLRMLEQYIGEESFRQGVGDYLRAHAYGNTETADLWNALEKASGQPISEIMDTWILQGGFPLVSVSEVDGGYELAQKRFRLLPDASDGASWRVPLHLKALGGHELERRLLDGAIEVPSSGPLLANAGGHGFYSVHYLGHAFDEVAAHYGDLEPLERFLLVDDTWGLALKGDLGVETFLTLLDRIGGEPEPAVWQVAIGGLRAVDRIVRAEDRSAFRSFVSDLIGDELAELGWLPGPGEPDLTRQLRGAFVSALGNLAEDEEVVYRCRTVVAGLLDDAAFDADPDVAAAAIGVVAHHGTSEDYERYVARYEDPRTPQERVRLLFNLPGFPDPAQAEQTFDLLFDGRIRPQDVPFILAALLGNSKVGENAWAMLKERWDDIAAVMPDRIARRFLHGLPALSRPETGQDVHAWFEAHPSSHQRTLAQQLELLDINTAFRVRESGRLGDPLTATIG